MKILYVNQYAGSPNLGMEFRPYYLGQRWLAQGHQVLVVAGSFSHLRRINPKVLLFKKQLIGEIPYLFLKTCRYSGNGVKRAINIFMFVAWLFLLLPQFIFWRPDIIVGSSTHPLDILPCWLLARLTGAKVIHEVHDLWPLTLTEIGGMSKRHPFVRLLQWAEDFSYKRVDRVVSMLEAAFPYMKEHGLDESKYCVVPNGIHSADWEAPRALPNELIRLLDEQRERAHFVIGYAGSMGVSNSLEALISALQLLKDESVSLILLGDGPHRKALEEKATLANLQNIFFFNPIDKTQIPNFLTAVDANFIGAPQSSLYRFGVSPNKLLDYLMAGKPILNAIEAGNNWVADANAGLTVPPENPKALADAIRILMSLEEGERLAMGQRGQQMVKQKFEYDYLAKKFIGGLRE